MPCRAAFLSCVSPTMGTEAVGYGAVDSHGRGSLLQDAPCPGGSSRLVWVLMCAWIRGEEVRASELALRGAWRELGMGLGWGKTESDSSSQ